MEQPRSASLVSGRGVPVLFSDRPRISTASTGSNNRNSRQSGVQAQILKRTRSSGGLGLKRAGSSANLLKSPSSSLSFHNPAKESFNSANIFPVQHGVVEASGRYEPAREPARPSIHRSSITSKNGGIPSPRRSVHSEPPALLSDSSPVELGLLLQVIHKLLSACEVKFTLEFINKLCASNIETSRLNVSVDQFVQELQASARTARSDISAQDPSSIIQKVFTVRSGVRSGLQSPELSDNEDITNGKNNPPSDKLSERIDTESTDRNSVVAAEEQSIFSKETIKPTGPVDISKEQRKSTDGVDVELGTPRVRHPPNGDNNLPGQSVVESNSSEGKMVPLRSGSAENNNGDLMITPVKSIGASLGKQNTIEEHPEEHKDHNSEESSDSSASLESAMQEACAAGLARDDLAIDLDDVSLEQARLLATPSDRLIIHPNNRFRVAWDLLVLLLIVCECVTLPLSLSFAIAVPDFYHIPSFTVLVLDMVLCFMTGYYHRDLLIMRRWRITRNYFQTWFMLDFVSIFPWEDVFVLLLGGGTDDRDSGGSGGNKTIFLRILKLGKLMRVLRLLRAAKIGALIKRLQNTGILSQNLLHLKFGRSVTKMFIVFGLLSHWAACVWGWIGSPETFGYSSEHDLVYSLDSCAFGGPCSPGIEGTPWRHRYGMDNYGKWTQYLAALHFTAALITGGDTPMYASYPVERFFTIGVMMCSIFVTSIVVGEILLIMNRQGEAKIAFDEQVQQAQDFMVARNIELSLQLRVFRYMETTFNIQFGTQSSSNRTFMQELSKSLQAELIQQLNCPLIKQHPFFAKLDQEAVARISQDAVPTIFAAGEHIMLKGDVATCAHWLVSGKVRVNKPLVSDGKVLYLRPPCWLGDLCLFVDTLRRNTVTAVVTTETLCLHKHSLQDAMDRYPSAKERFDTFREHVVKNEFDSLVCPLCQDIGHCEENCPELKSGRATSAPRTSVSMMGSILSCRATISRSSFKSGRSRGLRAMSTFSVRG